MTGKLYWMGGSSLAGALGLGGAGAAASTGRRFTISGPKVPVPIDTLMAVDPEQSVFLL